MLLRLPSYFPLSKVLIPYEPNPLFDEGNPVTELEELGLILPRQRFSFLA